MKPPDPDQGVFCSSGVAVHLLRGALGMAALMAAMYVADESPVAALALVVAALFALRGCPTCWAIGLLETIAARRRKTPVPREPG